MALRCEVSARPPLTALFWIIDVNGTTVTEGQVVNEYWTLVMVSERPRLHLFADSSPPQLAIFLPTETQTHRRSQGVNPLP